MHEYEYTEMYGGGFLPFFFNVFSFPKFPLLSLLPDRGFYYRFCGASSSYEEKKAVPRVPAGACRLTLPRAHSLTPASPADDRRIAAPASEAVATSLRRRPTHANCIVLFRTLTSERGLSVNIS